MKHIPTECGCQKISDCTEKEKCELLKGHKELDLTTATEKDYKEFFGIKDK